MLPVTWPCLTVLAVLIACGLGLPLPEDVPLLTGGFFCHLGLAPLYLMIPVAMVGVLAGDCVLFTMGRAFGHHIVEHRFIRRLVNPRRLVMAERLFGRHGVKIIFAGRFLPGLRPMIFVASGVLKVPFWKFAGVNGFAACISVPTLVVLGKLFGHNLDRLKSDVRAVTHFIALVVLIGALVGAGGYLHRRQRRMMASVAVDRDLDADTLSHLDPGGNIPIPQPTQVESSPPATTASSVAEPTTSR